MKKHTLLFLVTLFAISISSFLTEAKSPAFSFHVIKSKTTLNPDMTGTQLIHAEIDILTPEGIELATKIPTPDYDPLMRTLTIKEAFVLQPDGTKIIVPKENIFTRPSPESQTAPGFSNNVTTTLLFPQLIVGSRLDFTLEFTIKNFGAWGFFFETSPDFFFPTDVMEITIEPPSHKDLFLQAAEARDFPFEDIEDPKTHKRLLKAKLRNVPAHDSEPSMISPSDLVPSFYASTLQDWESCGRIYAEQSEKLLIIMPELQELSNTIVGPSKGLEAAQKIYNWVAQNITYVAVYLDPKGPVVPHSLPDILKNRYGDCKDQAFLMQALLKAQGIEAYGALISASAATTVPPIPIASYFDHIIIYLPKFDLYADPTVRFQSFGVLSPTLYDKFVVLAISGRTKSQKAKGKVARTPPLTPLKNVYRVSSKIKLLDSGTFEGENHIDTTGPSATGLRAFFSRITDNPEEIASSILQLTPEGGAGVFSSENAYKLDEDCTARGKWKTPKSVSFSQETFFQIPYGLDMRLALPFMRGIFTLKPRLYPLVLEAGISHWSSEILLSKTLDVFHLPLPRHLENSAGLYQSTYSQKGNSLFIERTFRLNKCVYPPQDQENLMSLVEILLQDLQQVVGLKRFEKNH
ncbi:MAG: hypothetical protein B7Y25_08000 [Alphaproteobacteria bacterium 16-39-46]|nr:MAG: hypothetical protein B7Y25_08000 [Alphaproteobacteria bacterium 16-39-46]OZA43462.1 MAG: hypothetical protein B7X84_03010 [Alphaproteobacteria bacterium 17-39-52]HQS84463.1 DUF3857 domain-containing protein [Alphaproteobacteria bacterium]HQS94245.1 DUF3857 domain-containing protein [Alphaproteobacteria bacterium]